MSDPSLALQGAITAALKTSPALCGGRVYDDVPLSPTFPYITIGEGQTLGDDNECFNSSEAFVDIHVWSTDVGYPEAKAIAALVRARLKEELTVTGFRTVLGEHLSTQFLRDPDGKTAHAVVEFRYLIDHDYN